MDANSDIFARASRVFTPAQHLYHPIAIKQAKGSWVTDHEGNRYLDLTSGLAVLNIGHCHPRVQERVSLQIEQYIHTGGIYYNETTVAAAELLTSITPPGLDMLFFSNTGAEAVEGALKLARYVTGRQGIIAFSGAFHGRTLGALSVTTSAARYRQRYLPLIPSVFHAPYPYCFRCPFGCRAEGCTLACLDYLKGMFRQIIPPTEVAAIIIEPILGEGGYVPVPASFLAGLRRLCDDHGILLIFDEVQSGMGRTGEWFAAQGYGVTPDIMPVAKGIASGFPLSAVVARRELMMQWPYGAHGTTFGGNPVSCAAAIATIDTIRDDGLLIRCRELGEQAMERLHAMQQRHPLIGNIRGPGAMIGVELVDEMGAPAGAACERLMAHCLRRGLILINCGPDRNILRILPPLTIADDDLHLALDILEDELGALA